MRLVLRGLIILIVGYLVVDRWDGFAATDTGYRMAALDAPFQAGRFEETDRNDLYVPYKGNPDYIVPDDVANAAISHKSGGRRWYSYHPTTTLQKQAVVFLFHGAGRTGLSMIDMWRDVADQNGIILIALNGRRKNWPSEGVSPTILHEILSELGESARLDMERVYLFGHSNGGAYTQSLINQSAGPWRAAAIHAGYADPATSIIPQVPKPIRFYLGTRDHIFLTKSARYVARALSEKGHAVDLHLIPSHSHWFYDAGPVIATDAWEWFSRQ
ncbi:MAG: prolyl oligopeptidase family serine peptidase [Paracoccaceae bacterium]